ncbi:uracil-DNA glycosylase [Parapusillimonas sp. JC17]|uniref:uracil-DNA glycosylase n=1 Tax=Parapusillimonas sp. JC17 TaxID=3445768 RepID=UPI003FA176D0
MNAPELTRVQIAWLQEIGIDRRMLAHYVAQGEFGDPGTAPVRQGAAAPSGPDIAAPAADAPPRGIRPPAQTPPPRRAPQAAAPAAETPPVRAEVAGDWDGLREQVVSCQGCALHSVRGRAVFGSGDVQAPQLMVIGEAPGGSDDRAGLPFQGKAGILLQAMLAAAGLDGATAFYTNLVKCRPLGNRPPTAEEVQACMPYLQRQISLAKPRHILALGNWAAQALLGTEGELDALRGAVHVIRSETGEETSVVASYHPAALLLRPQHKADAWRDLALLRSLVREDGSDPVAKKGSDPRSDPITSPEGSDPIRGLTP